MALTPQEVMTLIPEIEALIAQIKEAAEDRKLSKTEAKQIGLKLLSLTAQLVLEAMD